MSYLSDFTLISPETSENDLIKLYFNMYLPTDKTQGLEFIKRVREWRDTTNEISPENRSGILTTHYLYLVIYIRYLKTALLLDSDAINTYISEKRKIFISMNNALTKKFRNEVIRELAYSYDDYTILMRQDVTDHKSFIKAKNQTCNILSALPVPYREGLIYALDNVNMDLDYYPLPITKNVSIVLKSRSIGLKMMVTNETHQTKYISENGLVKSTPFITVIQSDANIECVFQIRYWMTMALDCFNITQVRRCVAYTLIAMLNHFSPQTNGKDHILTAKSKTISNILGLLWEIIDEEGDVGSKIYLVLMYLDGSTEIPCKQINFYTKLKLPHANLSNKLLIHYYNYIFPWHDRLLNTLISVPYVNFLIDKLSTAEISWKNPCRTYKQNLILNYAYIGIDTSLRIKEGLRIIFALSLSIEDLEFYSMKTLSMFSDDMSINTYVYTIINTCYFPVTVSNPVNFSINYSGPGFYDFLCGVSPIGRFQVFDFINKIIIDPRNTLFYDKVSPNTVISLKMIVVFYIFYTVWFYKIDSPADATNIIYCIMRLFLNYLGNSVISKESSTFRIGGNKFSSVTTGGHLTMTEEPQRIEIFGEKRRVAYRQMHYLRLFDFMLILGAEKNINIMDNRYKAFQMIQSCFEQTKASNLPYGTEYVTLQPIYEHPFLQFGRMMQEYSYLGSLDHVRVCTEEMSFHVEDLPIHIPTVTILVLLRCYATTDTLKAALNTVIASAKRDLEPVERYGAQPRTFDNVQVGSYMYQTLAMTALYDVIYKNVEGIQVTRYPGSEKYIEVANNYVGQLQKIFTNPLNIPSYMKKNDTIILTAGVKDAMQLPKQLINYTGKMVACGNFMPYDSSSGYYVHNGTGELVMTQKYNKLFSTAIAKSKCVGYGPNDKVPRNDILKYDTMQELMAQEVRDCTEHIRTRKMRVKVTTLAGSSGCGKSTMINLMITSLSGNMEGAVRAKPGRVLERLPPQVDQNFMMTTDSNGVISSIPKNTLVMIDARPMKILCRSSDGKYKMGDAPPQPCVENQLSSRVGTRYVGIMVGTEEDDYVIVIVVDLIGFEGIVIMIDNRMYVIWPIDPVITFNSKLSGKDITDAQIAAAIDETLNLMDFPESFSRSDVTSDPGAKDWKINNYKARIIELLQGYYEMLILMTLSANDQLTVGQVTEMAKTTKSSTIKELAKLIEGINPTDLVDVEMLLLLSNDPNLKRRDTTMLKVVDFLKTLNALEDIDNPMFLLNNPYLFNYSYRRNLTSQIN